jgi:hypothetical protein
MFKDRISQDIKAAMKIKDAPRLSSLRMIMAELQVKEKEKGLAVDDSTATQILHSMIRKRRDAIEQFRKGNREDLAQKEELEIAVIQAYLPAQLTDDEIRAHTRAAMAEMGAQGPQDMGKLMGVLMKKLSGSADGGSVSRIVKEELQKPQT